MKNMKLLNVFMVVALLTFLSCSNFRNGIDPAELGLNETDVQRLRDQRIFLDAIEEGNSDVAIKVYEKYKGWSWIDDGSLFESAVYKGDVAVVRVMMKNGAHFDSQGKWDNPLFAIDTVEMLSLVMDYGISQFVIDWICILRQIDLRRLKLEKETKATYRAMIKMIQMRRGDDYLKSPFWDQMNRNLVGATFQSGNISPLRFAAYRLDGKLQLAVQVSKKGGFLSANTTEEVWFFDKNLNLMQFGTFKYNWYYETLHAFVLLETSNIAGEDKYWELGVAVSRNLSVFENEDEDADRMFLKEIDRSRELKYLIPDSKEYHEYHDSVIRDPNYLTLRTIRMSEDEMVKEDRKILNFKLIGGR